MKKFAFSLLGFFIALSINAQAPNSFSYQVVIRNSDGTIKQNESVSIQIEILQGSIDGSSAYLEIHTTTTNSFGLVTLEIGTGTTSDDLSVIDWGSGPYYLGVTVNGTSLGATQLLSVPYALHSKSAESISGEIDYSETDPIFSAWDKGSEIIITESQISDLKTYLTEEIDPAFTGWDKSSGIVITESQVSDLKDYLLSETDPVYEASEAAKITSTDITDLGNLSGTNTGDQDLSSYATKDMGNQNITNLADPINDQDAATKAYVDLLQSKVRSLEQDLINSGAYNPTDADGNTYEVIKIGDQAWMAENLKTTKYNNGDLIGTTIPSTLDVTGEPSPKYQWAPNDNEASVDSLGRLYTWHAAVDDRNICPEGWHLPSDNEWTTLTNYLQENGFGYNGSGGDIGKSLAATSGWIVDNTPGNVGNDQVSNNSSVFSGFGSGLRTVSHFDYLGSQGLWWTSTELSSTYGLTKVLYNGLNYLHTGTNLEKYYGFSVRCIKDVSLPPNATTETASNTTNSSAQLNGTVNPNSLSTLVIFEYGTNTNYGNTVTASQSPASGNSQANFSAIISGLELGTTYHYRVKAVNSLGETYGTDMTFTTNSIQFGLYGIKMGTDELYFIDLSDNSTTLIDNIGLSTPDLFTGMQYIENILYIVTQGKLYSYDVPAKQLTLQITNPNLQWQFSINNAGELFSVTEVSGATQGTMYKIDIGSNTSTLIGTTGTPSLWGMGFDSNDQLWAVDELLRKYGTMNTNSGVFTQSSSTTIYENLYYSTPDNNGNIFSFEVGSTSRGIVKYNISSDVATMILTTSLSSGWAGLTYGIYNTLK